jgi:hypothetical protein
MDIPPSECIHTDCEQLEELCQIAQDVMGYANEENSWHYKIGCVLGNLSAREFPAMPEEHRHREAEYRQRRERYD